MEAATETKRPPGRPKGSGEGRDARAEWRTTPERKARAQAMADAAGMTLAAWLDSLVDKAKR